MNFAKNSAFLLFFIELHAAGCSSDSSHDSISMRSDSITDTAATRTNFVKSFARLRVLVLNRSSEAGTAGRMTDKLSQAVYTDLSPADTPQRYISSDVYLAEGWQTKAKEILQAAEVGEIDQPISMPRSSLEKIKSNLLSVFDVRGFVSTTTFIISQQ